MICTRCLGLMVPQSIVDHDWHHVSDRWSRAGELWGCVNCGDRLDLTIAIVSPEQRVLTLTGRGADHAKIVENLHDVSF